MNRRIIIGHPVQQDATWSLATTHYSRFSCGTRAQHEETLCSEARLESGTWYLAPEGTVVLCMSCIDAEGNAVRGPSRYHVATP